MGASAAKFMLMAAVLFMLGSPGMALAQDSGMGSQATIDSEMALEPAPQIPADMPFDDVETPSDDAVVPAPAEEAPFKEPMAPQWIWGEVVSVDAANSQLQIKHLDYDTYEEVTKVINSDPATVYENVTGLGDVRAGDSVTVDFKAKDGAQVAELVVVDKNRAPQEASAPAPAEIAPAAGMEPLETVQEPEAPVETAAAPMSQEEQDLLAGSSIPTPDLNESMVPSITEFGKTIQNTEVDQQQETAMPSSEM